MCAHEHAFNGCVLICSNSMDQVFVPVTSEVHTYFLFVYILGGGGRAGPFLAGGGTITQRRRSTPDSDAGDEAREVCDASGPVAHCADEADEAPVDGEAAVQAASQHRRVDVTPAQRDHHSETRKARQY